MSELPKPWDGHGWLENVILPRTLVVVDTSNEELNKDDNMGDDIDLVSSDLVVDTFISLISFQNRDPHGVLSKVFWHCQLQPDILYESCPT